MVVEHTAEAAALASLVLTEILAVGLFGDGVPGEVEEFVLAVNTKLSEIALNRGSRLSWQLVPAEPPKRAVISRRRALLRGNAPLPRRARRVL
jgi:hypothetical protein